MIHKHGTDFARDDINNWINKAVENKFDEDVDKSDQYLLEKYSTTPNFEVPWFCSTLRQAMKYVKENKTV